MLHIFYKTNHLSSKWNSIDSPFLPTRAISRLQLRSQSRDSVGHRQEDPVLSDLASKVGSVQLVQHRLPRIR